MKYCGLIKIKRRVILILLIVSGILNASSRICGQLIRETAAVNLSKMQTAQGGPTRPEKNFPNVKIDNFGRMDEKFYRGAQPRKGDYGALKLLGVKTVIDLRNDPTDYEKAEVEALGMRYVNIPLDDKKYPQASSIAEFLKLAEDPRTGIFFVHCQGGRHRTGVVGAVYRLTKYGWSYDQVYQEMKNYDFYTRWGHEAMKDFVVDYAARVKDASAIK